MGLKPKKPTVYEWQALGFETKLPTTVELKVTDAK